VRTGLMPRRDIVLAEYRFVPTDAPAFVSLVVEDTGQGMSADTMARMFDPFFSTKGSGRGLGLAAVLGIVRQSGGTMKVTSTRGKGTTITVLFPAAVAGATLPAPAARPSQESAPAPRGLVLLVDDEAVVRRATRRILERGGFSVVEAVNGQEAVDRFAAEGPGIHVIILDVTMPVMGGAEAFRRMRKAGPIVPVIVSSGYDQADTISAFTGDAVGFLQKPYRPEQLLAKIREMTQAGPPLTPEAVSDSISPLRPQH
jgi:two-component system cell cycle sensor histidine kinase/response regulator CckA